MASSRGVDMTYLQSDGGGQWAEWLDDGRISHSLSYRNTYIRGEVRLYSQGNTRVRLVFDSGDAKIEHCRVNNLLIPSKRYNECMDKRSRWQDISWSELSSICATGQSSVTRRTDGQSLIIFYVLFFLAGNFPLTLFHWHILGRTDKGLSQVEPSLLP